MKQSHHVDIQAPPQKVFHWLDDSQRVKQWVDGLEENEDVEVTEERVGSTFRQVYLENGRRMAFRGTVTRYEKDRALQVYVVGDAFDLDVEYRLEPRGASTRVIQDSEVHFKKLWRLLGPLLVPLMKKSGMKKLDADFARLKALCEQG